MIVSTKEDRRSWRATPPLLDVYTSDANDLVAFVQNASKDDLTVFNVVHGFAAEVPLFEAVLNHPDLDRATALTIFHACNPAFYENEISNGTPEADLALDEEDAIVLAILDMAHNRLVNGPSMTSRYAAKCLAEWEKFPHVSPARFKRWPLCSLAMAKTDGLHPNPYVAYDDTKIRLSFDVWQGRH